MLTDKSLERLYVQLLKDLDHSISLAKAKGRQWGFEVVTDLQSRRALDVSMMRGAHAECDVFSESPIAIVAYELSDAGYDDPGLMIEYHAERRVEDAGGVCSVWVQGHFDEGTVKVALNLSREARVMALIPVNLKSSQASGAGVEGEKEPPSSEYTGEEIQRLIEEKGGPEELDLSGKNLWGIYLSNVNLQGADLSNANLQWASLSDANFQGANLKGANLNHADVVDANLKGAN